MVSVAKRFCQTLVTSVCLASVSAYADTNEAGSQVKWSYIGNLGPSKWAQLDPRFALCASGKAQSPINIVKKVSAASDLLTLNYEPAPFNIVNHGLTRLIMGPTQTIIYDGLGIQLNFPASQSKASLVWDGASYRLVQLHFHSPSENQWHGQSYPMEIHFVHQGDDGQIVIIGVFIKGGKDNPTLQKIVDHLPKEEGKPLVLPSQTVDPRTLMPSKKDYYSFAGSLTVPPCTEGVQWIVMADPITASPAQIVQLRKAAGGANARPTQPLNGRMVSYSVEVNK